MRRAVMRCLIWLVMVVIKLTNPLCRIWKRLYFPAQLKGRIAQMDYSVQCDGPVYVAGTNKIYIGKRCRLGRGVELETSEKGRICLGDDIRINRGCVLVSYSEVSIGDYTIIGEYVSIRDANHGMKRHEPMRHQPHSTKPVKIGRDVWIGRGSCVLPGATIGEGAVVGANSVVINDVPPFSIVAGCPATVIKCRES